MKKKLPCAIRVARPRACHQSTLDNTGQFWPAATSCNGFQSWVSLDIRTFWRHSQLSPLLHRERKFLARTCTWAENNAARIIRCQLISDVYFRLKLRLRGVLKQITRERWQARQICHSRNQAPRICNLPANTACRSPLNSCLSVGGLEKCFIQLNWWADKLSSFAVHFLVDKTSFKIMNNWRFK